MKVALDEQIFAIQPYGGISRMFSELAKSLVEGQHREVQLRPLNAPIVNRYVLDDTDLKARLQVSEASSQWSALARYFMQPQSAKDADIVHNTFYLPHGLKVGSGAKRIITIHDMIPELLPRTRRRLDWITKKQRYVESADHIICVSEATKQDLIKVYGPAAVPISVIHHGVDKRFHPNVPRVDFLPERYVLFIGHRGAYKDADILFQAFAHIAQANPDLHILCVGGNGLSAREIARLEELGIRERVAQRYLSDELMASAYTHATLFVFPSHFEGFGLPTLEAMASGTPVILARATSLTEVGGDAAAYFEPGNHRELAGLMADLLHDDAALKEMSERGLERAQQFTWERATNETLDVYRSLLAGN